MGTACAAAAAVRVGCCFGAFLDGEGVPAAAAGSGVRVVDLEPGLLQAGEEVDRCALEVGSAEGIDDDLDALELHHLVALDGTGVEAEPVLEARAAAALDGDAQDRGLT